MKDREMVSSCGLDKASNLPVTWLQNRSCHRYTFGASVVDQSHNAYAVFCFRESFSCLRDLCSFLSASTFYSFVGMICLFRWIILVEGFVVPGSRFSRDVVVHPPGLLQFEYPVLRRSGSNCHLSLGSRSLATTAHYQLVLLLLDQHRICLDHTSVPACGRFQE